MKNTKLQVAAWILAIVSIITVSGLTIGRTAISEIAGLAVAQTQTQWNNVIDAAKGDGQGSGLLGQVSYMYNGATFDRERGTIANGTLVDVSRLQGTITPADAYANPTTANQIWSLGGIFNGSTWDRVREATADALAATGVQAVGNMIFNGSTWDRWTGRVSNTQGPNLFNSQTTGAATTAVTTTLTAVGSQRIHVYEVEGRCNTAANTSGITITDGGTTIWSTVATEVLAASNFVRTWPTGLTAATNSQVVITLAACAAGTGTLIVQADKF
jgi:hypothetical protein